LPPPAPFSRPGFDVACGVGARGADFETATSLLRVALFLLFMGIHNAWDSVAYLVFVTRPKLDGEPRQDKSSEREKQ